MSITDLRLESLPEFSSAQKCFPDDEKDILALLSHGLEHVSVFRGSVSGLDGSSHFSAFSEILIPESLIFLRSKTYRKVESETEKPVALKREKEQYPGKFMPRTDGRRF